jgi:hypothetical protein
MKKIFFIVSFILLLAAQIWAQEKIIEMPRFRLGVEAGMGAFYGTTEKPSMIRENRSYYYDYDDYDFHCGFILPEQGFNFFYFGLKPEYSVSKRLAVAAGLRFSYSKGVLDSDRDYFLWKISENETNTNFLKINSITQHNYYIGVPLELKYFAREMDYFVRQYFIAGTTLNFLVTSTNNVSFQNTQMEKYESEISAQLGRPDHFHGQLYFGVGLKIGRTNHLFGNVEFHFPVFIYSSGKLNSFTKTEDAFGFGIKTTLQIPILHKHKLRYTIVDD